MQKIKFEFFGGPNDGRILEGVVGEASDAERHYLFSNRGKVGHRLKVASPYAVKTLAEERLQDERRHHFQQHFYVVTDRSEEGDTVSVRAEYLPEQIDSRRSSR